MLTFSLWLSNPIFFISLLSSLGYLLLKKEYVFFLKLLLSIGTVIIVTLFLKDFFAIERPPLDLALSSEEGFGFPSLHAALAMTIAYTFSLSRHNAVRVLWGIFALGICWSRLYLGVHSLLDVVGGIALGIGVSRAIHYISSIHTFCVNLISFLSKEQEAKRQIFHLLFGIGIVLCIWLGIITWFHLLLLSLLGIFLSYQVRRRSLFVMSTMIHIFEREHHKTTFPGKGMIMYTLGASLTALLFEPSIACAALLLLSIGDAITHIVGKFFGKFPIPWNRAKNIEGPIAAILCSILPMTMFIPFSIACLSAIIGMIIETIPLHIKGYAIDDNFTIPIFTGFLCLLLLHYTSFGVSA